MLFSQWQGRGQKKFLAWDSAILPETCLIKQSPKAFPPWLLQPAFEQRKQR